MLQPAFVPPAVDADVGVAENSVVDEPTDEDRSLAVGDWGEPLAIRLTLIGQS